VGVSALAGLAFALERPFLAGVALLLAGFCDLIDGAVARAQGVSSRAGAFLDSTMDRLSDLVVFGGLACWMLAGADLPGLLLVLWALTAAVMTSYTRARAEVELHSLSAGYMERAERCVVLILGGLTGYVVVALWIVAIGATATSVQRIVAARRFLRELDETGIDPTLPAAEGEGAVAPEEASGAPGAAGGG